MNTKQLMTTLTAYNARANEQLVNWLSDKPLEALNQEIASSFNSLLKTLNHIWAIDEFWFATLTQQFPFANRYGLEELDRDEVFSGLLMRSKALAEAVQNMTEEQLSERISVVSPWLEATLPRAAYIQQIVNHASYHRGQIVTLARHTGLTDIPNTDYIFFAAMTDQVNVPA
ncbi:MAG: DinB family protein [Mucilaginibacter polytrichastri]|nr:DinB family protein [Mucilaginibacter polytrichastri]